MGASQVCDAAGAKIKGRTPFVESKRAVIPYSRVDLIASFFPDALLLSPG